MAGRSPNLGVRAYARTPKFGYPLNFREVLIIAIAAVIAGVTQLLSSAVPANSYVWPAAILWPIVLLIAAVQLLLYREPEGAYEAESGHGGHAGH